MTQQQTGKLQGQMEMVLTSLAELHQKVEASLNRCTPCKKDILEAAKLQSELGDKKQRNWILVGVVLILLGIASTFLQSFYNRTVAHTDFQQNGQEKK